jgi:hypothetical protein
MSKTGGANIVSGQLFGHFTLIFPPINVSGIVFVIGKIPLHVGQTPTITKLILFL